MVPAARPRAGALSPPRALELFERPATAGGAAAGARRRGRRRVAADVVIDRARLERGLGYEFWAYRDDDRVCLLSRREYWFPWVHECATVEEFAASGLTRVIPAGELSDSVRPSGVTPDELVVVTWGPTSIELEWSVIRVREAERQA